jgi:chemotaxis protein MotB
MRLVRLSPVLLALLTLACVPKKDFDALQAELDSERARLAAELATRDANIIDLQDALEREQDNVADLEEQIATLRDSWEKEVGILQGEKAELVRTKAQLKTSVDEIKAALAELAERKAQADERVAAYRDMLARFKTLIDAGRLKVKIVNGRMVVELATDVLFASGKSDLSDGGRNALAEVGAVLKDIPERSFQVEGHTDNDPIKTAQFPSNWELGSARAVTVVRALIEAGVSPERVSAASFSEFHPVAGNDNAEGKAANRRIEIVVVPDLSQLPGFDELNALSR